MYGQARCVHGAAQAVPWLLPGAAGALAGAPSASAARRRACHLRRTASAVRGCSCRSASHSRCQGSRQPPPRPRCRPSAGSAASTSASAPAPGGLRASRVLTFCTVERPVHGQGGCGWRSPLPRAPGQSQAAAAADLPATRVQRPGAPTPSQGGRQLGWQACWHILQACMRVGRPGLGEGRQAHPPRASCSAAACASVRARAPTAAAAPSSSAAAAISAAARPAPGPALRAAASAAGSHPRGRGRAYRPDCSASLGAPPLPAGASKRPRGVCSSRPARRRAAAAAPEQARATRAGSASASSPLRLRKLVTRLSCVRQGRVWS